MPTPGPQGLGPWPKCSAPPPGWTPGSLATVDAVDPLLRKLQHKAGGVVVLDAPDELAETLSAWRREVTLRTELGTGETFVLRFVRSCAEINATAAPTVQALADDGVVWFAYPKKSSKRYTSDIGRDDSWQALGDLGYEGVSQVAIDADWSALRFRDAERIATMRRNASRAISERGRQRLADS